MAGDLDYYVNGVLRPRCELVTTERDLVFPNHRVQLPLLFGDFEEGFETDGDASYAPLSMPGAWSSPSTRYPSDRTFQRTTSSPIEGSKSAEKHASLTDSEACSLGFDFALAHPSRFSLRWKIRSENNFDFFRIYIDGVETLRISQPTADAEGRFVSDLLAPGTHTLDIRATKDSSATESGEKFMFDAFKLLRDDRWNDCRIRFRERTDFDDAVLSAWSAISGSAGGFAQQAIHGGAVRLTTGTTTNDRYGLEQGNAGWILLGTGQPIQDWNIQLGSTANILARIGLWDGTDNNGIELRYDSSVSANWYLRTAAGSVTSVDTGIAASTSYLRARLIGNSYAACVLLNGQFLQSAASKYHVSNSNLPTGLLRPFASVKTLTGSAKTMDVDYHEVLCERT